MTIYATFITSNNLSGLLSQGDAMFEAVRSFERGTTTPGVLVAGAIWNKTDYAWAGGAGDAWMRYDGSAHVLMLDPRAKQINDAGTIPFAADQDFGGHKATGLADGVAPDDAATVGQIDTAAARAWTADHDAGGFLLLNLGSPFSQTSDQAAARYDDTWQSGHGLFDYIAAPAFETVYSSSAYTTFNEVVGGKRTNPSLATNFSPRVLYLKVSGNVTPIGGGSTVFTLAETVLLALRDPDNQNIWVALAAGIGPGGQYNVEVYLNTVGTRGFAVRIRRTTDNSLYGSAKIRAYGLSGVGFA